MAKFQVQLAGEWKDYARDEDQILKRAYRAGFPHCKFALRGSIYEYNFRCMVQQNLTSGKARQIRAPHGWQQPAQPVDVPKGPAVFARVPRGGAASSMQLDHPRVKGAKLNVAIPATAKPGQLILVPVPDVAVASEVSVVAGVLPAATTEAAKGKGRKATALIGMVRQGSNGVGGKVTALVGGARSKVGAVVGAISPSRRAGGGGGANKTQQQQQKEESEGWSKGKKAAAGAAVAVAAGLAAGGAVAAAAADGDAADPAVTPVVDCPDLYFEPYPSLPADDVAPPMCPGAAVEDSAGGVTVEEPPAAAADVPEDGGEDAVECLEDGGEDAVECLEEADLYLCTPEDEADELILDPDCGDAAGDWGDEAAEDLGGCIIDFF